jgi:two-component system LytT family response regulator
MISNYSDDNFILVCKRNKLAIICIDDLVKCEAENNNTIFYLNKGEQIIATKCLKEFEEKLVKKGFIRISRGTIIRIKLIRYIYSKNIELIDGTIFKLESKHKTKVLKIVMDMLN